MLDLGTLDIDVEKFWLAQDAIQMPTEYIGETGSIGEDGEVLRPDEVFSFQQTVVIE